MPILPYFDHTPVLGEDVTLAPDAYAIGKLRLDGPAWLGEGAVLRGDQADIAIGPRFAIGRRSTVHVDPANATHVGADVWVGEDAVVHGCTLGDGVRVEDGARVLSRARVGAGSVVAAGSLVPEGAQFPDHSYIQGTPGRRQRDTTAEERAQTREQVLASLASGSA